MQQVFRIEALPEGALDAAAEFHARCLSHVRAALEETEALVILFPLAPYDHRGWRLAAVQDLARAHAPKRVNGIAGEDEEAVAATLSYLASAPGVTGQLLGLSGNEAEESPY